MPFTDELGDEWKREVEYVGAHLKLSCPDGTIVSILSRDGGGGPIRYHVARSSCPDLYWPPDPTNTHYGERCPCERCVERLVGATVDELRAEVNALHDAVAENRDTYFLRYLESARDVIEREAQSRRCAFHRDASAFTDTYIGLTRRQVIVRYDKSFREVEHVAVMPATESYPGTLAGALAALRGEHP